MTKITLNYNDYSVITMEQQYDGAKVKITVLTECVGGGRRSKETIWTDKDSANKFYQNRIKDGYRRV